MLTGKAKQSLEKWVSILVFVELALEFCMDPIARAEVDSVSILVFVELALEFFFFLGLSFLVICFNPCFRGTCS